MKPCTAKLGLSSKDTVLWWWQNEFLKGVVLFVGNYSSVEWESPFQSSWWVWVVISFDFGWHLCTGILQFPVSHWNGKVVIFLWHANDVSSLTNDLLCVVIKLVMCCERMNVPWFQKYVCTSVLENILLQHSIAVESVHLFHVKWQASFDMQTALP